MPSPETVARSGATLLLAAGGLLRPDSGRVLVEDRDVYAMSAEARQQSLSEILLGRIGRAVARRAGAFGMRVAFTTVEGDPGAVPAEAESWARLGLDELLTSSDVVSVHVPLLPSTRHLLDQRAILRMKRRAYLVNTSRGPVVDEPALVEALRRAGIGATLRDKTVLITGAGPIGAMAAAICRAFPEPSSRTSTRGRAGSIRAATGASACA